MTPPKEPPSGLETKINQNNRLIEGLAMRVDTLDQSFDARLGRIAEGVEAITHQVGLFTEGLTRLENLIERQEAKIERILDAIQQQTSAINGHLQLAEAQAETAKAQAETAKAQASNIVQLSRMVELMIDC